MPEQQQAAAGEVIAANPQPCPMESGCERPLLCNSCSNQQVVAMSPQQPLTETQGGRGFFLQLGQPNQQSQAGNSESSSSAKSAAAAAAATRHQTMQACVQRVSASLGRHEQVVARLKQQLAHSLSTHEVKLTQELQDVIKQATLGSVAGAAAGAAAAAAFGAGSAVAAAEAALAGTSPLTSLSGRFARVASSSGNGRGSSGGGGGANNMGGCGSGPCIAGHTGWLAWPPVLGLIGSHGVDYQQLQTALTRIAMLQQQLEAAEAKLDLHRSAAGEVLAG